MAVKEPAKESAPSQPTTQVRQPGSPDTKTIRTNDPVTNKAEEQLANEQQEEDDAIAEEQMRQQEEEAERQQEEFKLRQDILKEIAKSPEGFVVREEGNSEALGLAQAQGLVYHNNVQSGKGGLDVEERYYISHDGFENLRTAFGPSLGV